MCVCMCVCVSVIYGFLNELNLLKHDSEFGNIVFCIYSNINSYGCSAAYLLRFFLASVLNTWMKPSDFNEFRSCFLLFELLTAGHRGDNKRTVGQPKVNSLINELIH